jgi:hypothetical protein
MKLIEPFKLFEARYKIRNEYKDFLDKCVDGTWSLNQETGKVDIDGNFKITRSYFYENGFPFQKIKFGKVSGNFDFGNVGINYFFPKGPDEVGGDYNASGNRYPAGLKKFPIKVGGDFNIEESDLNSLEGCPKEVGGNFRAKNNRLRYLEGCPEKIGGDLDVSRNQLISLGGCPEKIGGSFIASDNKLESLIGGPKEVGNNYRVDNNPPLKNLEGAPEEVKGDFYASDNIHLQSLIGGPKKVGGTYDISASRVETLEGAPDKVGEGFVINRVRLTLEPDEWNVQGILSRYKNDTNLGPITRKKLWGLISPETLQKKIDQNPEKMAVELKSILNLPEYKDLKFPDELKSEVDLLSDLADIGL